MAINWRERLTEVGIAGAMAALWDAIRDAFKKGVENGGEQIGKATAEKFARSLDDQRVDLLVFLRTELAHEDRVAADNLVRWQEARQACLPRTYGGHEPYQPGDENHLVQLLTKFYKSQQDTPERRAAMMEVMKELGHLSDMEFDRRLEFLSHDFLTQWARLAGQHIRHAFAVASAWAAAAAPFVAAAAAIGAMLYIAFRVLRWTLRAAVIVGLLVLLALMFGSGPSWNFFLAAVVLVLIETATWTRGRIRKVLAGLALVGAFWLLFSGLMPETRRELTDGKSVDQAIASGVSGTKEIVKAAWTLESKSVDGAWRTVAAPYGREIEVTLPPFQDFLFVPSQDVLVRTEAGVFLLKTDSSVWTYSGAAPTVTTRVQGFGMVRNCKFWFQALEPGGLARVDVFLSPTPK